MRTITGNIVAMKMRKSLMELNLRLNMAHVMVWISIGKVNVAVVISTIQTMHTIILLVCTLNSIKFFTLLKSPDVSAL